MANGTEENVAPLKDTVGRGPVEPPISEKPVSEEPVSEPPVSEEPVSEEPVSEPPVSERPVSQTPDSEDSVKDASVPKANANQPSGDERPTPERASEVDGLLESSAVVRAAEEAEQAFAELRQSLPTGLPRLWLRQAANPSPAQLRQWRDNAQGAVQSWLLPAANATAGFVIQMIFGGLIMIVAVFFFFADGERMTVNVMRLIPLDIRHQQELLDDFAGITRAVVTATIVAAVAQGVLAGFGFWVSGVESVMFLVLLTIVLAMIPFVGAMSVWIPVCLWIGIVEGRIWTALLLATYSGVVVSQVDNIIKPMILQGRSNLHPLLALLSVLGGVKALGPIGILIGPMVVVFLQTLLKILHREMTNLESPARRSGTVPDIEPPLTPNS
jgi:predicted PurR-regulated permease PerM